MHIVIHQTVRRQDIAARTFHEKVSDSCPSALDPQPFPNFSLLSRRKQYCYLAC